MKSCGDPNALLSKESILVVTKAAVSASKFFFYIRFAQRFYLLTENVIFYIFAGTFYCIFNATNVQKEQQQKGSQLQRFVELCAKR